MSYDVGSKIVTNGLVFGFNANSERSYAGPPIQNMATTIATSGSFSDTNIGYTAGTETVNIPTLGSMTVPYMDGFNANPSSYCCLQPFYFVVGNGFVACSGSTQYTYSIVYRTTSGYTHPNYMYRYEYTSGGSYVTEVGVHDDSKRVHLGDGWYWAWNTFTTQATTARLYLRSFYYQYNISDRHSIARVLVTPGDYTSLPPRLWPAVGTTRSNTQAFVDAAGNATASASNLTYAADGSFSFNGSSDYIRFNNSTALDTQTPTVEVWVRTNSLNQNGFWFEKGSVNTQYALFQEGTAIQWRQRLTDGTLTTLSTASSFISTSNWAHVVATYATGSRILYVNGVQVNSDSQTGTIATNNSGMFVGEYGTGAYRYNGSIGAVRVYNRVLTADEVRRNFNAQRSRYGV